MNPTITPMNKGCKICSGCTTCIFCGPSVFSAVAEGIIGFDNCLWYKNNMPSEFRGLLK